MLTQSHAIKILKYLTMERAQTIMFHYQNHKNLKVHIMIVNQEHNQALVNKHRMDANLASKRFQITYYRA